MIKLIEKLIIAMYIRAAKKAQAKATKHQKVALRSHNEAEAMMIKSKQAQQDSVSASIECSGHEQKAKALKAFFAQ